MFDIFLIVLYLLLALAVGIYKSRAVHSIKDFSIGDRNHSTPVLVSTLFATMVGGGSTLGISEKVFSVGLVFLFSYLALPLGRFIIAWLIAPRMKPFMGLLSVGDMMLALYGPKAKWISGIGAIFCSVFMVAAQFVAIGYILQHLLGWPKVVGVFASGIVVIGYSAFGGIKAVTITDVFQFVLLILAVPLVFISGLVEVGGLSTLFSEIPKDHLNFFPTWAEAPQYLVLFFILLIPRLEPALVQRMLIAKEERQVRRTMWIYGLMLIPFFISSALIGLMALSINPNLDPNLAYPFLLTKVLPSGLFGLAVVGLLAVTMSTADSYLHIVSVSYAHDLMKPWRVFTKKKVDELKEARLCTIWVGFLAMGSAVFMNNIIDINLLATHVWLPFFTPPLLLGLFGVKRSEMAFLWGLFLSISLYVFLQYVLRWPGFVPTLVTILFHVVFLFSFRLKKK